ncbi:50S ribosomal protein L25/general stress protein Ctc [Tenacibaculum sp. IMCC1]|uniref:Large ribosomal subunit protein bL25 n=1 Tax=Tenacibaculum sp. Pbs-1 TaxID=3238748 RepID=A0AB33KZK4_9FLAO|nr:50S ribosomal protein L25/general stress protein Ctc [Tenacibaculum mesophilum]GFD71740.1 50S ribosomal protein L25 [Tenacibaculum sp. KUL113]
MKSITIKGSQRESVGKKATKALRNAGKVPCVLYGGDKPVHFSADEKSFKPLVYTPDVFTATIELDGVTYSAVLQDIQFHPVNDSILHVDFYQLFEDKAVTMDIPVRLVGSSKGVMVGGALRHNLRKLKVKALPANLPDFIEANITELEIGNKLYVTELKNDNYTLLHPDNTVVAQVRMSRNAAKAAAEAEA